ncbi:hypothetical protein D0C16_04650 [Cellvibrio sp. KY-GH-1]|uniref:hypothetical protein n=1 Tax=Cellvibrio sp. KY-GH-1 TaxID=2303332 RepID=UPI001247E66B|nr:hypothetical protein [Cellvibrio sp. KY-GH-1]QEY15326.1 hypothetical protein D0C16_04650 [Cellvibrio sp. KY-GH-1]
MISDVTKANILIAIAEGQSVADAAKCYGLNSAQARGALPRFCRHLKLRWDLEEIRANPKKYIDAAIAIISSPKNALRRVLRNDLVVQLKLRSPDELTPQYVSNITAEALLSHGVTETGLVEVQEWLLANELSCKRKLPEKDEYLRTVKKAITLLDAFGLDVSCAKAQLSAIDE